MSSGVTLRYSATYFTHLQGLRIRDDVFHRVDGFQVGKHGFQIIIREVAVGGYGHRRQNGPRTIHAFRFALADGFDELRLRPGSDTGVVGSDVGGLGDTPGAGGSGHAWAENSHKTFADGFFNVIYCEWFLCWMPHETTRHIGCGALRSHVFGCVTVVASEHGDEVFAAFRGVFFGRRSFGGSGFFSGLLLTIGQPGDGKQEAKCRKKSDFHFLK